MGDGENFSATSYTYLDGSAGLSLNSGIGSNPDDNFVLGVAYHHFNSPKNSFFNNDIEILQVKSTLYNLLLSLKLTLFSYIFKEQILVKIIFKYHIYKMCDFTFVIFKYYQNLIFNKSYYI